MSFGIITDDVYIKGTVRFLKDGLIDGFKNNETNRSIYNAYGERSFSVRLPRTGHTIWCLARGHGRPRSNQLVEFFNIMAWWIR
ncbi:hypothetical protein KPST86_360042 [Klebsiella pneumoniae subsp. pneumoniae SA1]|nr:hypothetical protein KPST86_360042 [Klebsiella pneumoniae subsp. pneumoniae SA1]